MAGPNRYKQNVDRLVARSRNEIARMIKDQPLGGDQSRSLALGANDPRNRSGPDGVSSTGQRYNPEHFFVDDDGRLNMRREAVKSLILESDERSGSSAATTRRQALLHADGQSAPAYFAGYLDRGHITGPYIADNTDRAYWRWPIPTDCDRTVDMTLYAHILEVGNSTSNAVLRWEFYANKSTDTDYVPAPSADGTFDINFTAQNNAGAVQFLSTTITAATVFPADTLSLFIWSTTPTAVTPSGIIIFEAYMDYTTT